MTDVLGMELARAQEILAREGFTVRTLAVSSRKGVRGNEARVIRQRRAGEQEIELAYAIFKTDPEFGQ